MVEKLVQDALSENDSRFTNAGDELRRQVLADRFDVVDQPLGWRCRSCAATVSALSDAETRRHGPLDRDIARLAESAADHAMYCGRCDD